MSAVSAAGPAGGVELVVGEDAVTATAGGVELLRYVLAPQDPQMEAPRPYVWPLRTLGGRDVATWRPHDHVWHKGLSFVVADVSGENFWGGPTYDRELGYVQRENDGAQVHVRRRDAPPGAFCHELAWVAQDGRHLLDEVRTLAVALGPVDDGWRLDWRTALTNRSDAPLVLGSPTTLGRPDAGYGGLFWRGPRAFAGGAVHVEGASGGDELMGARSPWAAYVGRHDGADGSASVVMARGAATTAGGWRWFARTEPFATLATAPFFDEEVVLAPGERLDLDQHVVVVGSDAGADGCARVAAAVRAAPILPPADAP